MDSDSAFCYAGNFSRKIAQVEVNVSPKRGIGYCQIIAADIIFITGAGEGAAVYRYRNAAEGAAGEILVAGEDDVPDHIIQSVSISKNSGSRSEERRVGKECRSR